MHRIAAFALLASIGASTLTAQMPDKHLIITSHLGVFSVDRTTGVATTIATESSSLRFYKTRMDVGNDRMMTLFTPVAGANSYLIRVYPSGAQTTIASMSGTANDLTMDQDGQWLITTTEGRLYRTQGILNNRTVTTVMSGLGTARGLCLDQDTGDYVIGTYSSGTGRMLRIDRQTLNITTLKANLPQITSIEHNQRTGHFTAVSGNTTYIVNRVGGTVTTISRAGSSVAYVDDITGHTFIAGGSTITEYDPNYQVVRSHFPPSIGSVTGMTMFGSQVLAPATNASSAGGNNYRVVGYFPDSKNANYVCAMSFSGMRPGFDVASTRRINIVPDAVFFATFNGLPLFTKNFRGTTSSVGFFFAEFLLPVVPSSTPPVTFTAVAINPSKPGGLDIASSWTVKIEN